MSWATRRRVLYILGLVIFFGLLIGGPILILTYDPPTCYDGVLNRDENQIDRGGPCLLLAETSLSPYAVLWTRSFKVRDGAYDTVAYIENPNSGAGVRSARYSLKLYDSENVIVAEKEGTTFIMPGGITPVFFGSIPTGNREVTRAFFCFTDSPPSCEQKAILTWHRMDNPAHDIMVSNRTITDTNTMPRVSAKVKNNAVKDIREVRFIVVLFDPAGNAFAASQTELERLNASEEREIVLTWPRPFNITVGRIDVIPVYPPELMKGYE